MPVIQVQYPAASLDTGHKAALGARLTDVLLNMEGGARTPGGLAFATVIFSEVPQEDWYVGGLTDTAHVHPPGKFMVRVTIPEGYMSQTHKSEVHAMVNAAFLDTLGGRDSESCGGSILVIIEEVSEGDWGCAGKTISLASIASGIPWPLIFSEPYLAMRPMTMHPATGISTDVQLNELPPIETGASENLPR